MIYFSIFVFTVPKMEQYYLCLPNIRAFRIFYERGFLVFGVPNAKYLIFGTSDGNALIMSISSFFPQNKISKPTHSLSLPPPPKADQNPFDQNEMAKLLAAKNIKWMPAIFRGLSQDRYWEIVIWTCNSLNWTLCSC